MGGNLLKNWDLPDKRLNVKDYERLKHEVVNRLELDIRRRLTISPYDYITYDHKIGVAPAVRNKESHGDLDIIIGLDQNLTAPTTDWAACHQAHNNTADYIEMRFGYAPHINSNVYSFPYDGFQVDITFVPLEEYRGSINYTSWGDLGNIMGCTYQKLGLHYGHNGLQLWVRQGMFDDNIPWSDADHIYGKVTATRNTAEIFRIGDFDYDHWKLGFDTEEQVFEFVSASSYFDPAMFQINNLNHTNRTRNRKRGRYMRFLEWLGKYWSNYTPGFIPAKKDVSLYVQSTFPHVRTAVDEYRFKHTLSKAVSEKINGNVVKQLFPMLSGKDVGAVMDEMRKIPQDKILMMSEEMIRDKVYTIATYSQPSE